MDLFAVIADPTRRQMIDILRAGETAAGVFVSAFPAISQPAISQHLKVLRDSGVATVRADRQRRLYSLNSDALRPLVEWLAPQMSLPPTVEDEQPAPQATGAKKSRPKKLQPEPELTLDLFG